jgi:hypothetical protein
MSDNEENVLEDFSGMTEVNGVMITPPENIDEIEDNEDQPPQEEESKKPVVVASENLTKKNEVMNQNLVFPQIQKPKFFDILKSLGTTTLIVMGLVMLFLLFVGYKYLFG